MGAVGLSVLQTWIVIELFFLTGTDGPTGSGLIRRAPRPNLSIVSRSEPFGVPDFLLHRAGSGHR